MPSRVVRALRDVWNSAQFETWRSSEFSAVRDCAWFCPAPFGISRRSGFAPFGISRLFCPAPFQCRLRWNDEIGV
jgi:hypothetical protein